MLPMFTSSVRLSPECQKAVKVLEGAIDSLFSQDPCSELPSPDVLCSEGRMSFHRGIVTTSHLPHAKEWIWNQSRGKKTLSAFKGDKKVTFYKLNTRSKGQRHPPAIKLWIFNIETVPSQESFTILWCEKSDQPQMDSSTSLTLTPSDEAFLSEHCQTLDLFPFQPDAFWDIDLPVDLDLPVSFGSFYEGGFQ